MAVIYVPGAITGTQYPIQISGDAPTPTEQARIDQYIAQQEAAAQSQYESIYGPLGQRQAEAPPEDTTAFGRGLESGIASLRRAYGSTLEGIGGTIGLTGLAQYGADIAEEQGAEMQRLAQAAEAEKAREDQGMIGRGATYVGEIAGQSAPQTATSLLGSIAGGAAAGLAAGSFTGPGALAGAALGGAFAALPYFYGDFREQQKEADIAAGRPVEVDEGAAALAAIPAATLDAILGAVGAKVGANVLTKVAQQGGVFTRATRGAVGGVADETPTELGQEVLGRLQAGEDLLSEEAIEAYKEAVVRG